MKKKEEDIGWRCRKCNGRTTVCDSRQIEPQNIYRRRRCLICGKKYTTYEVEASKKAIFSDFLNWEKIHEESKQIFEQRMKKIHVKVAEKELENKLLEYDLNHKEVITLRQQGKKYREIAEILNLGSRQRAEQIYKRYLMLKYLKTTDDND